LNLVKLQVSTPTRTLSLNHTLLTPTRSHTFTLSLSLSPLSLSLACSLTHPLSHTYVHTHTIALAHRLTYSLKLHTHCLSLVCLLSLLLPVLCVYSLHRRRSYVCHVALFTNSHALGTPTPGRTGRFLFTPIYFNLIQFRFWRACAPSFPSLVLTPFFGFFVSHSQPESGCERLNVSMHTQFDYSRLSKVCMKFISFSPSLPLALSRHPFHPSSRLYLCLSPEFSVSLPPFQLKFPDPLFLSPTTLPRFYSHLSACVHVSILIHIFIGKAVLERPLSPTISFLSCRIEGPLFDTGFSCGAPSVVARG